MLAILVKKSLLPIITSPRTSRIELRTKTSDAVSTGKKLPVKSAIPVVPPIIMPFGIMNAVTSNASSALPKTTARAILM